MKDIEYLIAKAKSKIFNNKEHINLFFRNQGMRIGVNCNIVGNISTPEADLISIGNNVTVGDQVDFITHDNSISKIDDKCYNLFGRITIGDNCFIGERSIIMYGVTLANNIIVASGSVVVNSFSEEKIIIGGNPAVKIGTWDNFYKKSRYKAMSRTAYKSVIETNPEMFIERKVK